MYYGNIKKYDVADGEGVRVTLFISGCRIHCPGCFQPETWDFRYGQEYTEETQKEVLDAMDSEFIAGLTVLGGEPFEPENQRVIVKLMKAAKERYPEKNIWCWSGYLYDRDLQPGGRKYTEVTDEMLSYIDILVDGSFMLAKKNLALSFRGSENQRVIDLKKTRETGEVVLHIPMTG
ncbi:MAG: anaerobic ribonucleoside-triphosphate reductase activating protein [Solobacterium sp.]|nr:anaerobic ribonucleoside-triphosphate reductase activating protein [Solobacterium sp.]